MINQKNYSIFVWGIFAMSTLFPIIVWGSGFDWDFSNLTLYGFFPLLGLLAWMIMWTHYVNGFMKIKNPEFKSPKHYSSVTAYIVLAAFLLHPGLLALAQFQNDAGLPPSSFFNYLGDGAKIAVLFGSVSLTIFLSFEYFNRVKAKAWAKKWWIAISISQSIAMTLIFVHGLRIGSDINGWFTYVWIAYGLILIPCFYVIHENDLVERAKLNK